MTDAYETDVNPADIEVGSTSPEVVVEDVGREDFVRYAGASGDFNPIHYDEPFAQEAGQPGVFGQGMLTAGYAAHVVADWFGLVNVTRFDVRFQARLWPGDTVTASGEVSDVDRHKSAVTVVADLVVTNQDGEELIVGEVEAELPPG
jgi:peroxisomal enoyl-CoA hydratase 2